MALRIRKLLTYVLAGWVPGGSRECPLCGHQVWRFMPYRNGSAGTPPLITALDVIGSDVDHFECPRCGGHDRERHLLMYFRAGGLMDWLPGRSVLHFAPERHLSRRLTAAGLACYIPCDLYPQSVDVVRVDMLDMQFEPGSFDLVIANHVLEHVGDVAKALLEVFRVLKPGGLAVLQTPYSTKLHHTWSDPGIDSDDARLHAHGQEDHVRLFGRDVFGIIEAAGFESKVRQHADALQEFDAGRFGVNPHEPFFLFRRLG